MSGSCALAIPRGDAGRPAPVRRASLLTAACAGRRVVARAVPLRAALLSLLLSPAAAGAQQVRVHRAVETALARAGPGAEVPVLVELDAPLLPSRPDVVALRARAAPLLERLREVEARGVRIAEQFWVVPAAVATATAEGVEELAARPGVRRVWLDEPIPVTLEPATSSAVAPSFTSEAMRTIGADAVWEAGVTGEGITVAFFDTGVEGGHALLASRWRGRRASARGAWFDPFRRASQPQDLFGHGTQVALAAVGALRAGDTLRLSDGSRLVAGSDVDVVTGPAPRAEWIAARIFDSLGGLHTRRSVILQAFQWALDPDGDPLTDDAPQVINNSWGIIADPEIFDPCADVIYSAIDAAEAAGIAVVFAAGNAGPAAGSVQPPAARDDPQLRTFAAGATTGSGGDVTVAPFSGRGPSPCNGGTKPELVAPARVPEMRAEGPRTARLSGFTVEGTSFAAPQVSGTLALVLQVRPSAGPEEAKRILLQSARDLDPVGPDNDSGHGLLDVPAAVSLANPSFAGALLQVRDVRLSAQEVLVVLANRGRREWPGGTLEVAGGAARGESAVGSLPPGRERGVRVAFAATEGEGRRALAVTVRDASGGIVLSRLVLAAAPDIFGGFVLEAGELRAGANDFGRLGRLSAPAGFTWRGQEVLPGGAFLLAAGARLSDAIYVTALGQPELKSLPAAAETDWAPVRGLTDAGTTTADVRFDDLEALEPVGAEVDARLAVSEADGAGALTITALVRGSRGGGLSAFLPGVFADWDLPGGEVVRWAPEIGALVAAPRAGGGPVTLLATDGDPVGRADVPLGTPGGAGFYEPGSGVLADGDFPEEVKRELALGAPADGLPGAATATDRAALLSAGPFDAGPGERALVRFWLVVADDEATAAARLARLRQELPEPPSLAEEFVVRPPFPNPLRVGQGTLTFPFELPASLRRPGAEVRFEIYDVGGRRLVERRIPADPASPLVPPQWNGLLGDGEPAAAGVYLFVFRLEDEVRSGRILLLR